MNDGRRVRSDVSSELVRGVFVRLARKSSE